MAVRSRVCWNESPPQPNLPRLEEENPLTPDLVFGNSSRIPGSPAEPSSSDMASFSGSRQAQTPAQWAQVSMSPVPPIEELKPRGKGQYICPEGLSCTKGGVQADGTQVIFQRNSAFRSALPFRTAHIVRVIWSKLQSRGIVKGAMC